MKILKSIWTFIVLNFRWVLFVICILGFCFFQGFIKGAAIVGFFWTAYASWKFYLSNTNKT